MSALNSGTVSVMLSAAGSALRARVRAGDAAVVERALAVVRDDAAAIIESVCATSTIRPAGQGVEGSFVLEAADPVSRRGLRRVATRTEESMRRLGYRLDREVRCDGGQVVAVYARHHRGRA